MRDPHIHAEKTPMPGFGHPATRELIVRATDLVPDLPKTVGTGCGVLRPLAMTSTVPEKITCLACRDWARIEYLTWAAMAQVAAELAEAAPEVTPHPALEAVPDVQDRSPATPGKQPGPATPERLADFYAADLAQGRVPLQAADQAGLACRLRDRQ
jgi:hypothetical protein